MVERQHHHHFEQVLGRAALSLALPDPPAPIFRLMNFSRRPAVDFPRAASGAARSVYSTVAVDGHFPGV